MDNGAKDLAGTDILLLCLIAENSVETDWIAALTVRYFLPIQLVHKTQVQI